MPSTSATLTIFRAPPRNRSVCTTMLMAEAICPRMARDGSSVPARRTNVSRRVIASRGLLAWSVLMEPSWPVFIAWSMSSASPPRTSPTMIRSGRMRSELRTRSRIMIWPRPSTFAGFDSRLITCTWRSRSSAASSHVTMRSLGGMNPERTLSNVVLPDPVPPETMTLSRVLTAASRYSRIASLEPAVALDEDLLRPVDHDLRDIRVAQRRFEWTEPDDLVEEDLDQALAVGRGDERGRRLEPEVLVGELREQAPDAGPVRDVDRRCVPAQEVGMDFRLRGSQRGTEDGRAVGVRRLQDGLAGRPLALHRAPFDRGDARRPVDWGLRCRDWRLRSGDWRLRLGDRGLRSGRRRLLVATVEIGRAHV